MRLRLRRTASTFPALQERLETGDPTAYAEIGPPVFDQVRDSVWDQVRVTFDPNGEPCPHGLRGCRCTNSDT